ncbi:hypothetical protein NPX13_g10450 [Xylaria arbuscula]|uniref:Uncharacterized protein n=1 Tax=Xylaria arbuscula TaxID=114810 RepID=A0A9W8N4S1_9PEZI|nr:hypothetical protein NPX13_g10450 [Xylaria arbuscula]
MSITFHLPSSQVNQDDLYRLELTIQDDGTVDWDEISYIEIMVTTSDGRPTANSRMATWAASGPSWHSVWAQQWFKDLEVYGSYRFTVSLQTYAGTIKQASSTTITVAPYFSN